MGGDVNCNEGNMRKHKTSRRRLRGTWAWLFL